jgi:hypothetical protein
MQAYTGGPVLQFYVILFIYLLTMAGGGKPRLRQDIQDTIKTVKTIKTLKYTAFKKMTKICFRYSCGVCMP